MRNLKFLIKEKLLTIVGQIYSDECKTFSQNESFQITSHSLLSLIGITLVSISLVCFYDRSVCWNIDIFIVKCIIVCY